MNMNDENIEKLIAHTSRAIYYGRSRQEIIDELMKLGYSNDEIFLIYQAANALNRD